jgi:hypothetical protein
MSTMAVQLVVSASCQLPGEVVSCLRLSRLLPPVATDNWHWQLSQADTGN